MGDVDSEVEEYLIEPTIVFKAMPQPKKDLPILSRAFWYVADATLAASMQDGTLHEWVLCGLKAVCRTYGLSVLGTKVVVLCWRVLSTTLQATKCILFTIMCTTSVDYKTGGR